MTQQNESLAQPRHTTSPSEADLVVGVDGSPESFAALRWALKESVLSGQHVTVVFGWTQSWDVGAEPQDEFEWRNVRASISKVLDNWVNTQCADIHIDRSMLRFMPVQASGPEALLETGQQAQQIVVGRRSLGRVARWFLGSTSASLVEDAQVPVTVVRIPEDDAHRVEQDIEHAFTGSDEQMTSKHAEPDQARQARSIVVGVDGSALSLSALRFAVREAKLHQSELHVLYCWQLKDLGVIPGYENAIAPIEVGQQTAEATLNDILSTSDIPPELTVHAHAFHISPAKGLINASRYASWIIVGSRGLSGLDAHFLGSVSKQMLSMTDCTVTVVR